MKSPARLAARRADLESTSRRLRLLIFSEGATLGLARCLQQRHSLSAGVCARNGSGR